MQNVAVFGASGAIGGALVRQIALQHPTAVIHAISRNSVADLPDGALAHTLDYTDEQALSSLKDALTSKVALDTVVVATGMLHSDDVMPEKSLRDLSADKFQQLYEANTIAPALIAKHFLPAMPRDDRAVFAALSARVGSISDNRLGGWYAYRASKAALNMMLKNASIEMGRTHKHLAVVGLHPGTVDSDLSKPFQKKVPDGKLFTPDYSGEKLLEVITRLDANDSGKCFAWDGAEIPA